MALKSHKIHRLTRIGSPESKCDSVHPYGNRLNRNGDFT
jgi:hypothetical protein